MWGFLKCNYSYTKILIVLLFSLTHPPPPGGKVIPPHRPAQAAPGAWCRTEPAGVVYCLWALHLGRLLGAWEAVGPRPPPHIPPLFLSNIMCSPDHNVIPLWDSLVASAASSISMALGLGKVLWLANLEPDWKGTEEWKRFGLLNHFQSVPAFLLELQ